MKILTFNHEELALLIYALASSKTSIDESYHTTIDNLIKLLNK